MKKAIFRFYAELNDFLPLARRHGGFIYRFQGDPSVKDAIEALGVPHTEVDLILVNGESVGYDHRLCDRDRITVYPLFTEIDVRSLSVVRPPELTEVRFVLDGHLGQLCNYLRRLGFDTSYSPDMDDDQLAKISAAEDRVLLTKDRGLLKRSVVRYGFCVRSEVPRAQIIEVIRRFHLVERIDPFSRCVRCNGRLERAERSAVIGRAPQGVVENHSEFSSCPDCGQVFWKGSHFDRLSQWVEDIVREIQS
jgi:uncharacterized protein with PIN domain